MSKEFTIYTKWLAYELRKQGFRIIRTDINPNFPQFDCDDLHYAVRYLTEKKRNNR